MSETQIAARARGAQALPLTSRRTQRSAGARLKERMALNGSERSLMSRFSAEDCADHSERTRVRSAGAHTGRRGSHLGADRVAGLRMGGCSAHRPAFCSATALAGARRASLRSP